MKNRVHPELREMFSVLPEVDNSPENFQQYRKWAKESLLQQFYYRMMKLLYLIDLYLGLKERLKLEFAFMSQLKTKALPGVLWIHGGGYQVGSPKWMTNFVKSSYWKPTV